jgi:putative ABC transport system permease protein
MSGNGRVPDVGQTTKNDGLPHGDLPTTMRALTSALRSLLRTPAATFACLLTLSLGVAASTAIYTLLDALLLRPLPYPHAERLVQLEPGVSWGDVMEIEGHARGTAAIGAWRKRTWGFTDSSSAPVEVVLSGMVTHGFFQALGVAPRLGAGFSPSDETPGANRVAWLSDQFWRKRYAGRLGAVGQTFSLNDVAYRVAGVLPADFRFPMDGETPDLYIPLDRSDYCCDRTVRTLGGVARLRPAVSHAAARAEFEALCGTSFDLVSLQRGFLGNTARPLLLMSLAAGLALALAALNAAGILLAAAARQLRESAIRLSLGASRPRLAAECAARGFWLGLAAGATGLWIAALALSLAQHIPALAGQLDAYRKISPFAMGLPVAAFACATALAASMSASLAPLWLVRDAAIESLLRRGAVSSPAAVRGRGVLLAAQVALAATLLSAGVSVFAELRGILQAGPGFRTGQIVIAGIGLPEARYDTDARMIDFHRRAIARLAAIPGVREAAGGAGIPFGRRARFQRATENLPLAERPRAVVGVASPGLLALLGIALLRGGDFSSLDRQGQPYVALVNRKFVERYGSGVGARLRVGFWNGHMRPWPEVLVIGEVADARNLGIDRASEPAIYLSSLQVPMEGFLYFVRTALPAASLASQFRQAVWSEDPRLERIAPRPLAPLVERDLESRRAALWLLGAFSAFALAVASAGLAAGVGAWVTESQTAIGIRMALGETPSGVLRQVLAAAGRTAGAGVLLSLPASFLVTASLRAWQPGFERLPWPAWLVSAGVIIASSNLAALPAAWRAARLDPAYLLRQAN